MNRHILIPFDKFPKPTKIDVKNGRVTLINNIEGFKNKKINQEVSIYFVIKDSIKRDKKGIIRFDVSSIKLKKQQIFRKNVFEAFDSVRWGLRIPEFFSGFILLCGYVDRNDISTFTYYNIPEDFSRKDRKLVLAQLTFAARENGISDSEEPYMLQYVKEERYKKHFGYEPNINLAVIDENKYFQLLNIQPTEDMILIRNAYKNMVKKYHPDLTQSESDSSESQKMKEINIAYEYLYGKYGRTR